MLKLIIISVFLFSCSNNDVKIAEKDVQKLSKKYSKSALNYFYELSFYDEAKKEEITLKKWKSDIVYFINGKATADDLQSVEKNVKKLNDLHLPIKFSISKNVNDSNVIIHFGKREYFKDFNIIASASAMANTTSKNGVIYKGEIVILDEEKNLQKREALILEEMVQIIGSITDSFSYPDSVFYQGKNAPTNFKEIDVEVIKLLYDNLMPVNYSISQFENDFKDVLYYVNTTSKLKKTIIKENIDKEVLEEIKKTCFIDGEFYKHPKYVQVHIKGFNQSDSIFIEKSIKSINKISKNLYLKITKKNDLNPNSGIYISLTRNDLQDFDSQISISNGRGIIFKPKRYESIVDITYRNSIDSKKKHNVILKSLYKSLGPTETKEFNENWFVTNSDEITLSKKYFSVLQTIYEEEFVDGLKLEEFENIIDEVY